MKLLYFDLETTGTDKNIHAIHQLSGMIEIDGQVKEEFDFHIRPFKGAMLNQKALEIGGINREDLEGYEPMQFVYNHFVNMLNNYIDKFNKQDKFFLVGYNNASFDNPFLRKFFERNGDQYFGSWFWANPIDVYVLASYLKMGERTNMSSFKLVDAARCFGIEVDESKLHNSMYDIYLTKSILDIINKSFS